MAITIAIGTDHRGFLLKQFLIQQNHLDSTDIYWLDVGCHSLERTDYPIYAQAVVKKIISQEAHIGILLCSNGLGMAIAANRFKKIYAAVAWNALIAVSTKEDDNCNILCLPSDYMTEHESLIVITAWLTARFKHDRYAARLELVDTLI